MADLRVVAGGVRPWVGGGRGGGMDCRFEVWAGRGIGAIADLRFGACDVRNDAGEGVHS